MSIKQLSVLELNKKINNKENILLIDCREISEWNEGHIEEAVFMPLSNFEEEAKKLNDVNKEIIIQCRSGVRSMKACSFLNNLGFTNLSNLEGGILAWHQNNFKITK